MSYRRVQKKRKASNYCIYGSVARYGPRNQLPAQGVKACFAAGGTSRTTRLALAFTSSSSGTGRRDAEKGAIVALICMTVG